LYTTQWLFAKHVLVSCLCVRVSRRIKTESFKNRAWPPHNVWRRSNADLYHHSKNIPL